MFWILRYKKDVFVDEHEWFDMVKKREQFLRTMKELKPYLVEFEENGIMKAQNYPLYCKVKSKKHWPIIVITNDECIFSSNDVISMAGT